MSPQQALRPRQCQRQRQLQPRDVPIHVCRNNKNIERNLPLFWLIYAHVACLSFLRLLFELHRYQWLYILKISHGLYTPIALLRRTPSRSFLKISILILAAAHGGSCNVYSQAWTGQVLTIFEYKWVKIPGTSTLRFTSAIAKICEYSSQKKYPLVN